MNPCALNISTETLSAYDAHLLPDNEQAMLDAHVGDCVACRHHLAAYNAIRQALRRQRSPIDAQTVLRQLNGRIMMKRGTFMSQTAKIAWLSGLALTVVVIVAFVAVFALQPSHHTTPITSASPTPTGTATITPTMTATPEPTLTAQQLAACFGSYGNLYQNSIRRAGNIAILSFLGPLAYPSRALPEGASSPYKLTGDLSTSFAPSFVGSADPYFSPSDHTGNPYASQLFVIICNLSPSTTLHVSEMGATISQLTPYTGNLNVWIPLPCDTSYYSSSSHQVIQAGGCGGSTGPTDFQATATFPSGSATGTMVIATMTGNTTLLPGKSIAGILSLTLPSTPGTYAFVPTLKIDGGAQIEGAPGDPYIYAPVAHVWDGKACANMSIPASPPAYYICRN